MNDAMQKAHTARINDANIIRSVRRDFDTGIYSIRFPFIGVQRFRASLGDRGRDYPDGICTARGESSPAHAAIVPSRANRPIGTAFPSE